MLKTVGSDYREMDFMMARRDQIGDKSRFASKRKFITSWPAEVSK